MDKPLSFVSEITDDKTGQLSMASHVAWVSQPRGNILY